MKAFLKRCDTRITHLVDDHLITYFLACIGFGSIIGPVIRWVIS